MEEIEEMAGMVGMGWGMEGMVGMGWTDGGNGGTRRMELRSHGAGPTIPPSRHSIRPIPAIHHPIPTIPPIPAIPSLQGSSPGLVSPYCHQAAGIGRSPARPNWGTKSAASELRRMNHVPLR
jgi:hypothetical protein